MSSTSHGREQKRVIEAELKARLGSSGAAAAAHQAETDLLSKGGAASAKARSVELDRPELTATDVLQYAASQYPELVSSARAAAPQTDAQRAILEAAFADRDRRFVEAKRSDEAEGQRLSARLGAARGASEARAGGTGSSGEGTQAATQAAMED